jgi:hypothetical protein
VVVDAIDDQAARFYRHFNFRTVPDRLFLPVKTIATLFGWMSACKNFSTPFFGARRAF